MLEVRPGTKYRCEEPIFGNNTLFAKHFGSPLSLRHAPLLIASRRTSLGSHFHKPTPRRYCQFGGECRRCPDVNIPWLPFTPLVKMRRRHVEDSVGKRVPSFAYTVVEAHSVPKLANVHFGEGLGWGPCKCLIPAWFIRGVDPKC